MDHQRASELLKRIYVQRSPEGVADRLAFLDGLRGFTALTVVFFHSCREAMYHGADRQLSPFLLHLIKPLMYGRFMVDVFIVLSGFCLMIPVVRSEGNLLRGGFSGYMIRRARRILPPYYAALAIMMLILAADPGLQQATRTGWDISQPSLTQPILLSHLFLIHNWSPAWIYKLDSPLWSVATEWQIYFLFPLVLLPVWRRLGVLSLLFTAGLIGWLPHSILGDKIDLAAPWFILLFAMGMAGALAVYGIGTLWDWLRNRARWSKALVVSASVMLFCVVVQPPAWGSSILIRDTFMGIVTMCLIVTCALESLNEVVSPRSVIMRSLTSPGMLWLGTGSYSIYLVHYPIISLFNLFLNQRGYSPNISLIILILFGVPLSVLLARLFYLAFEKPFLSH